MSFSVSVDTSKLQSIIDRIPGYRDKVVEESAKHILGQARMRAPYKTGALRDDSLVVIGSGYTNVEFYQEYAPYVELGTHKMPPRPFLKNAVEAETKLLTKRLKEGLIEK